MKNQNTIHTFKYWLAQRERWTVSNDGAKILTTMAACALIINVLVATALFG